MNFGQLFHLLEFATVPSKRQSLIPFPRVGKRATRDFDSSFHRRILRAQPYWLKRDDFKRRITRRSSWSEPRPSRSSLSSGRRFKDEFHRRITRSWDEKATEAPELNVMKRQSLIPFPRTGKRSGTTEPGNRENDQIYMYEVASDEEGDDLEAEPEPEPLNDEELDDVIFDDEEPESESLGIKRVTVEM